MTIVSRSDSDLAHPDGPVELPQERGPASGWLLHHLRRPVHDLGPLTLPTDDPIVGEDSALALYLCYELHYLGLPDVEETWEWAPSLLAFRARLEQRFEAALIERIGHPPMGWSVDDVVAELRTMLDGGGPSLSAFLEEHGTVEHLRELAVHRSAYQLKEADPHTWGIPRLFGRAKAGLLDIQRGEYGDGDPDEVHATLFARTMEALGLDARYGALLDDVPAISLSTCNLISLFGLHRRWRGALAGHLALFEMCSVGPMGRYQRALERLGFDDDATAFYAAHVLADQVHEVVAIDGLVRPLVEDEPFLGGEVVFGARALHALEAELTAQVLGAWDLGRSSLRPNS